MDASHVAQNLDPMNLTAMSFMCWYAWYTAHRVIPKMVEDHRTEMAQARKDFKEEIRAEREHCSEELAAMRVLKDQK